MPDFRTAISLLPTFRKIVLVFVAFVALVSFLYFATIPILVSAFTQLR